MKVNYSESSCFMISNIAMMLKDYLSQHDLGLKSFADQCGLSAPTILRAQDGINIPSRRTLEAIVSATKGAVTIQDLIRVELKGDDG